METAETAKARLIAAAPELLAACKRVLEWIETCEFEDRNYEGEVGNVMRPLRAAINKAEKGN